MGLFGSELVTALSHFLELEMVELELFGSRRNVDLTEV
jgi:hypothetical protein